jgi:hypothetical protein
MPTDASAWAIDIRLDNTHLKEFDVASILAKITQQFPELGQKRFDLYTILSELYSNALEHGILKLDSSLKHSITGMAHYYAEREKRLKALTEGFIAFKVTPQVTDKGLGLLFQMTDSGEGFDHAIQVALSKKPEGPDTRLSGRGMTLVAFLCEWVRYLGNGNQVEALYVCPSTQ